MAGPTPSVDGTTMDLYKLAVEMADRTSARRLATNTFFVTLHSSLAVIVGVVGLANKSVEQKYDRITLVTLAVVGLVLSLTWWALLRYYRRLNRAKFTVINDIEKQLPVKPFTDEWTALHPDEPTPTPLKKWQWIKRSRRSHREATLVEQIVPWVFAAIYVVLGLRVFLA